MIGKYAPDSIIGKVGAGGAAPAPVAAAGGSGGGGGGGGLTMAEVGKHNSKSDCWASWFNELGKFVEFFLEGPHLFSCVQQCAAVCSVTLRLFGSLR